MADTSKHRLYWFLDEHFGRLWNQFKELIGRTSDPKWLRRFIDWLPGYYPTDMND